MEFGIKIPQGCLHEYGGWDPGRAWRRTADVARRAEELGFHSVWVVDHLHANPTAEHELTFESFTTLAAVAALTHRVRLGHLVICAGYRNPALTAKMVTTLDVISGGRMTLGIGAGWKGDEALAYGYDFPPLRERLAVLSEQLEVISAMLRPGRATYKGRYVAVDGAISEPKGLQQPRVPILVGGNGPDVTWRIAARFADELNLDGLTPDEFARAIPAVRERCTEVGRDPATLRVSVLLRGGQLAFDGERRIDLLGRYQEAGAHAVVGIPPGTVGDPDALDRLAADARAAGVPVRSAADPPTQSPDVHVPADPDAALDQTLLQARRTIPQEARDG